MIDAKPSVAVVEWPDIGVDPMQGPRDQYRGKPAIARLREAYVRQQPVVPNQTALIWRADLGFALQELTRLYAWAERQNATPEQPEQDRAVELTGAAEGLIERLNARYTVRDEFSVTHPLCNPDGPEAAAEIKRLRGLLIDPGDPAWEDARAVLVTELRKLVLDRIADEVAAGHGTMIPSGIALNLIAQAARDALDAFKGEMTR